MKQPLLQQFRGLQPQGAIWRCGTTGVEHLSAPDPRAVDALLAERRAIREVLNADAHGDVACRQHAVQPAVGAAEVGAIAMRANDVWTAACDGATVSSSAIFATERTRQLASVAKGYAAYSPCMRASNSGGGGGAGGAEGGGGGHCGAAVGARGGTDGGGGAGGGAGGGRPGGGEGENRCCWL